MDGRGRIAQSLIRIARLRARPPTGGAAPRPLYYQAPSHGFGFRRLLQRCWIRLLRVRRFFFLFRLVSMHAG